MAKNVQPRIRRFFSGRITVNDGRRQSVSLQAFPRPVTLLVEFEGVDDVLPDAVEAAGDGGYRGHVGVAQPDQEA